MKITKKFNSKSVGIPQMASDLRANNWNRRDEMGVFPTKRSGAAGCSTISFSSAPQEQATRSSRNRQHKVVH